MKRDYIQHYTLVIPSEPMTAGKPLGVGFKIIPITKGNFLTFLSITKASNRHVQQSTNKTQPLFSNRKSAQQIIKGFPNLGFYLQCFVRAGLNFCHEKEILLKFYNPGTKNCNEQ